MYRYLRSYSTCLRNYYDTCNVISKQCTVIQNVAPSAVQLSVLMWPHQCMNKASALCNQKLLLPLLKCPHYKHTCK